MGITCLSGKKYLIGQGFIRMKARYQKSSKLCGSLGEEPCLDIGEQKRNLRKMWSVRVSPESGSLSTVLVLGYGLG
jgi:hypothetical protein